MCIVLHQFGVYTEIYEEGHFNSNTPNPYYTDHAIYFSQRDISSRPSWILRPPVHFIHARIIWRSGGMYLLKPGYFIQAIDLIEGGN